MIMTKYISAIVDFPNALHILWHRRASGGKQLAFRPSIGVYKQYNCEPDAVCNNNNLVISVHVRNYFVAGPTKHKLLVVSQSPGGWNFSGVENGLFMSRSTCNGDETARRVLCY